MNWKPLVVVGVIIILGNAAHAENDLEGDWITPTKGIPALSQSQRDDIMTFLVDVEGRLEDLHLETIERFSLCDLDVEAKRSAGTLEKLSVPYQVFVGDIKLLRHYAASLKKAAESKTKRSDEVAASYTQFRIRLALAGPLMREVSVKSKTHDYGAFNKDAKTSLREFQIEWIPSTLQPEEWEATLWSLIRTDLQTFLDNVPFVAYKATPSEKVLIEKVARDYQLVTREIGNGKVSREKAPRLIKTLNENVSKIATKYKSLGETAEESLAKVREFSAFVYFLGANHTVGEALKALEIYYARTRSAPARSEFPQRFGSSDSFLKEKSPISEVKGPPTDFRQPPAQTFGTAAPEPRAQPNVVTPRSEDDHDDGFRRHTRSNGQYP